MQILQTLLDCNRMELLPEKLTTEDVRPRDRHEHKHLEAVMGIATMIEEKQQLFNHALVICTRHPSPYPFHDAESIKNHIGRGIDLAISPDFSSICLCADSHGNLSLLVVNASPTKKCSIVNNIPNNATQLSFVGTQLFVRTSDGELYQLKAKGNDWVTGMVERLDQVKLVVTCGMEALNVTCIAGVTCTKTILLADSRSIFIGEVAISNELVVNKVLTLHKNVLALTFSSDGERIFGLSHGGAIFEITGSQATGYHLINIYTQPAAKSITATLDAIYVARGAYIDQLLFIDVAAAVVTTLLKPAPENSILVDDLATTATSGNIIAITCIGNSVQFLDGAAKALRFLCFGSSLMAYIK